LRLVIDTGHAQIVSSPAIETRNAGARLMTTHVHDNDGRRDTHLPPGEGVVDWPAWLEALDEIEYTGPIVLECIRELRNDPTKMNRRFFDLVNLLTGKSRSI
jgi:sugar phosphate isomerase/epimerase